MKQNDVEQRIGVKGGQGNTDATGYRAFLCTSLVSSDQGQQTRRKK